MHKFLKSLPLFLFVSASLFFLQAFQISDEVLTEKNRQLIMLDGDKSSCHQTAQGPVIDWQPDVKLNYTDFKAGS
jgi:hypothetical protein